MIIFNKQKKKKMIGSTIFKDIKKELHYGITNKIKQFDNQGYQFWAVADEAGYFSIGNVRPGEYNLYAWVPGFIGDYHNGTIVSVTSGKVVLSN